MLEVLQAYPFPFAMRRNGNIRGETPPPPSPSWSAPTASARCSSIELVAPHLKGLKPRTIRDELAERLHQFRDEGHAEGRNRSLLACLDFSRRRLSPEAQADLPLLGWFEGGVFEG